MSSKSTGSTAADPSRGSAAATTTSPPEVSRQQFARGEDWAAAAFRTAAALQQVTAQMSQRAALLHAQAAENARKAASPVELAQVQSSLLVYEWQEWTRYSQECLLACSRVFSQPAAGGSEPAPAKSGNGAHAFPNGALGPAGPMVQAWQQMFASLASENAQARE